ncbi:hypothetical protein B0H34DRAFT_717250 [Crassisporium funariophilum]|nr:hypothetical protein B0H34DRAFT_717250 [Crassisporium funariophilum]
MSMGYKTDPKGWMGANKWRGDTDGGTRMSMAHEKTGEGSRRANGAAECRGREAGQRLRMVCGTISSVRTTGWLPGDGGKDIWLKGLQRRMEAKAGLYGTAWGSNDLEGQESGRTSGATPSEGTRACTMLSGLHGKI